MMRCLLLYYIMAVVPAPCFLSLLSLSFSSPFALRYVGRCNGWCGRSEELDLPAPFCVSGFGLFEKSTTRKNES